MLSIFHCYFTIASILDHLFLGNAMCECCTSSIFYHSYRQFNMTRLFSSMFRRYSVLLSEIWQPKVLWFECVRVDDGGSFLKDVLNPMLRLFGDSNCPILKSSIQGASMHGRYFRQVIRINNDQNTLTEVKHQTNHSFLRELKKIYTDTSLLHSTAPLLMGINSTTFIKSFFSIKIIPSCWKIFVLLLNIPYLLMLKLLKIVTKICYSFMEFFSGLLFWWFNIDVWIFSLCFYVGIDFNVLHIIIWVGIKHLHWFLRLSFLGLSLIPNMTLVWLQFNFSQLQQLNVAQ